MQDTIRLREEDQKKLAALIAMSKLRLYVFESEGDEEKKQQLMQDFSEKFLSIIHTYVSNASEYNIDLRNGLLIPNVKGDGLSFDVTVQKWELKKFDVDPITGEKTLAEVMVGGDHRETQTYRGEELLQFT